MSAHVVNLRDFQARGVRPSGLPPDVVRIDRLTQWGNPFRIGDPSPAWTGHVWLDLSAPPPDGATPMEALVSALRPAPLDRDGAIYHFRIYAADRLLREPEWLEPLRGKRLACWCHPLSCHGDIIVEMLGDEA